MSKKRRRKKRKKLSESLASLTAEAQSFVDMLSSPKGIPNKPVDQMSTEELRNTALYQQLLAHPAAKQLPEEETLAQVKRSYRKSQRDNKKATKSEIAAVEILVREKLAGKSPAELNLILDTLSRLTPDRRTQILGDLNQLELLATAVSIFALSDKSPLTKLTKTVKELGGLRADYLPKILENLGPEVTNAIKAISRKFPLPPPAKTGAQVPEILLYQMNNGAGLQQDEFLRLLLARHHPALNLVDFSLQGRATPFIEPFLDPETSLLLPEQDYCFHWLDFYTWRTDTVLLDRSTAPAKAFCNLPKAVIHSFNVLGDGENSGAVFHSKGNILLEGISFLLQEGIVHILIRALLTERGPDGEMRWPTDQHKGLIFFYVEYLVSDWKSFGPAFAHSGALIGSSYPIPDKYDDESLTDLFTEWTELCLGLPGYFNAQEVKLVKRRTRVKRKRAKELLKRKKGADDCQRIRFRIIKTIKKVYVGSKKQRKRPIHRTPPKYQVPVGGFWRKVKGIGKDRYGRPIRGKTWVIGHTRYRDNPLSPQKVVLVKEPFRVI